MLWLYLPEVYSLKNIKHVVLDEADTLLDDSFNQDVMDLFQQIRIKSSESSGCQVVLVSATIPQDLENAIGDYLDLESLEKITTNKVHEMPSHVTNRFLRLRKEDREPALLKIVTQEIEKERPVMIFSNRSPMSNWIAGFLQENSVPCLRLNKSLGPYERQEQFEKFQRGDYDVISCTDLGSRGLDTTRVRHVINFECPHQVANYLHRAGRTGRVGSHAGCKVTSFVVFKPDVALVQNLERSVRLSKPLENVDGNIKRIYKKKWLDKQAKVTGIDPDESP